MILVTLALFLVMLEKQSHQIKTLIRLELVTLVVLVTLDRQKIFEEFMACKKTTLPKILSGKSNVTNITNVTRIPEKPDIAGIQLW